MMIYQCKPEENFDAEILREVEYMRECFEYRDGDLYWKVRPRNHFKSDAAFTGKNRHQAGQKAKVTVNCRNGYGYVSVRGIPTRVHRVIYAVVSGELPQYIDHINGIRMDNRIENLRSCTSAENNRNAKTQDRSSSGVKGVHWIKKVQKWGASIEVDGVKRWLGTFESLDAAAAVRKIAATKYHGEFARHA